MSNVVFYQNSAVNFEIILLFFGNVHECLFTNTKFVGNTGGASLMGGYSYVQNGANITLQNVIFYNNSSEDDGGSFNMKASGGFIISFLNCIFSKSHLLSANAKGGAVSASTEITDNLIFENCSFFENLAATASVIYFYLASSLILNCAIFENLAIKCIFYFFSINKFISKKK